MSDFERGPDIKVGMVVFKAVAIKTILMTLLQVI